MSEEYFHDVTVAYPVAGLRSSYGVCRCLCWCTCMWILLITTVEIVELHMIMHENFNMRCPVPLITKLPLYVASNNIIVCSLLGSDWFGLTPCTG